MDIKICKQCGKSLPITDYYKHNNWIDTKCKYCKREYSKQYQATHSEQIKNKKRQIRIDKRKTLLDELYEKALSMGLTEVPNFPGYYADTNGNIYSTRKQGGYRREPTLMNPVPDKDGYLRVNFYRNGKRHYLFVHRVIAKTFIPNIDDLPQVNHIDGDITNNKVENLEWCTMSDNIKHRIEVLKHDNIGIPKPIVVTDKSTGTKFFFESSGICAKYLNLSKQQVLDMLSGKSKKEEWKKYNNCTIEYWEAGV